MHRPSLLSAVVVVLVAACTPAPGEAPAVATPAARDAPERVPRPSADLMQVDGDAGGTSASAEGGWMLQETDPPRAVWGAPASEGQLEFSCDRERARLVLSRQAVGVPADVRLVSLDADGTRVDYPAERRDAALAPLLVTPIALDAPIVDRMLASGRLVVTAGSDAIVAGAPGGSLRAVVDACRRGQPG